ncbi:MAG: DUF3467 domain-containing protein [Methanothrix sp.]|jgi:hypothetical protein|nr:DUF3467 domain-containing protein [Methanothrix sp.]
MTQETRKEVSGEIKIDLNDLYKTDLSNMTLNLPESFYSNLAITNVSNADIRIDFLQVPGLNKDGKSVIEARRILLPHSVAQKLAALLLGALEKAYNEGKIEQYMPTDNSDE